MRLSKYNVPLHEMACPRHDCVYNKAGFCDEPRINRGNGDAECHKMSVKDVLAMLGVVELPRA